MRLAVVVMALVFSFAGLAARAQDAWVQIEAQPTLREGEERARAYSGVFPNVSGYALASGWYAIVLGPYPPEEAARQLELLRGERLIPSDSYIADAGRFRQRFWPVGEAAVVPAAPAPAEAATETPVIATAEPAPV